MNIIVIDIGGTNIKYAMSDEHGNFRESGKVKTEAKIGAHQVYKNVCNIIDTFEAKDSIDGIAISTAGQVNAQTGAIIHATDGIPGYTGFQLRERLMEQYSIRISVENDVNCAALGELWKGKVRDRSFIAITIGTGIGGAVVIDGHIYHGAVGSAGEIGHMTLVSGGLECNCGYRGCFERYASSQALDKMINKAFLDMETSEFFEVLKAGNELAREIFKQWIEHLTDGLRSIVHIFNPSEVLIGGGITVQGAYLKDAIVDVLDSKIMKSFKGGLHVGLMTLGNDANLYGALYWFVESELSGNDL